MSSRALLVCALLVGAARQESERAPAAPIRSVDEALAELPPIGREGTYVREENAWDLEPAVSWLREHLARGGTLDDEQWRRALLCSGAIRVRERWPATARFAVSLEIPLWLPRSEIRLYGPRPHGTPGASLAARAGSSTTTICGNCDDAARRRARYQELELLSLGSHVLPFGVVVEQAAPEPDEHGAPTRTGPLERPRPVVLWSGSLDVAVEIVPELDDVLPPVHNGPLDAAVRKLLTVGITRATRLTVHADLARAPELATTAVSLELELLEGALTREQRTLFVLDRPGWTNQGVSWELPSHLAHPGAWSIRVRGSSSDALRAWDALRRWDGELVIPLADAERR